MKVDDNVRGRSPGIASQFFCKFSPVPFFMLISSVIIYIPLGEKYATLTSSQPLWLFFIHSTLHGSNLRSEKLVINGFEGNTGVWVIKETNAYKILSVGTSRNLHIFASKGQTAVLITAAQCQIQSDFMIIMSVKLDLGFAWTNQHFYLVIAGSSTLFDQITEFHAALF